jgi:hypothetical protein
MKRRAGQVLGHVGLVGKIDPRLDERERADQPLPPALRALAEQPLILPHRLRALRLGLGEHQVGEALDGGEIEPPVRKRAAGELARLRGAQARQPAERVEHAAITALPPCRCSSAMSSPVSVAGPGSQSTSASSSTVCVAGSRKRRSAARPRLGQLAQRFERGARARPETRTTAIAAGGRPEESAKMVGRSEVDMRRH